MNSLTTNQIEVFYIYISQYIAVPFNQMTVAL